MLLALIAALAISTTTSNSEIRNISVWHQPAQLNCYQHFRFDNKAEFNYHHDALKACILAADTESTIRITTAFEPRFTLTDDERQQISVEYLVGNDGTYLTIIGTHGWETGTAAEPGYVPTWFKYHGGTTSYEPRHSGSNYIHGLKQIYPELFEEKKN